MPFDVPRLSQPDTGPFCSANPGGPDEMEPDRMARVRAKTGVRGQA